MRWNRKHYDLNALLAAWDSADFWTAVADKLAGWGALGVILFAGILMLAGWIRLGAR